MRSQIREPTKYVLWCREKGLRNTTFASEGEGMGGLFFPSPELLEIIEIKMQKSILI